MFDFLKNLILKNVIRRKGQSIFGIPLVLIIAVVAVIVAIAVLRIFIFPAKSTGSTVYAGLLSVLFGG